MTANIWLGIDIAKDTFEASLLLPDRVAHGGFANTPAGFAKLDYWLHKRHVRLAHVCLEATGRYSEGVASRSSCRI